MALAGSLQKVAKKVIGKFGGAVTFRLITRGAYNTTTGEIGSTTSTTNIKGVLDAVKAAEVNELVKASDKKLTVAALDLSSAPDTKDEVEISGVRYQIVEIGTIEQGNTAIVYDLFLRG